MSTTLVTISLLTISLLYTHCNGFPIDSSEENDFDSTEMNSDFFEWAVRENHIIRRRNDPSQSQPEWQNACGNVIWPEEENTDYPINKALKDLSRAIRKQEHTLKVENQAIITNDMQQWQLHEASYSFLPSAYYRHNANISLLCLHNDMQIYVGAFDFLHKMTMVDRYISREVSKELNTLLISAKDVLCEVETFIRVFYPRNMQHISTYTTTEMSRKMEFKTNAFNVLEDGMYTIDMKYTKYLYRRFLHTVKNTLHSVPRTIRLVEECKKN